MTYDQIKASSLYLRDNYDPEVIFHATKQLLELANPKAKALFTKIIMDPLDLTEAVTYVKGLEKSQPVLTHEDFFKIHDNVAELSINKLTEIATTFREG